MLKYSFFALAMLLPNIGFCFNEADSEKKNNITNKIRYISKINNFIDKDRYDTVNIVTTPYGKIEYLSTQVPGIGAGRPGTEEFLNADILIKLKKDNTLYGLSLSLFDTYGSSQAIFETLMAALIHDLFVEIVYYDKKGTKQILRVTVKK